jgi:hypothetical protein
VNRAGDTITGALRVNGGLQLGGEGSTLELGAGAATTAMDKDGGKIAFRAFSQGLDIVGVGPSAAERRITFHAQGGASIIGNAGVSGDLQYSGRLSKLDTAEQNYAMVRAADLQLGHSTRRGTNYPAMPLGRALVDWTDTLQVNYASDWPKTLINGSENITLDSNEVVLGGQVKVSGGQVRNAAGFGIFQTNANDWLRINMDQFFPAIALYKPVAIGTGGLAVGTWDQVPAGQLRVSGNASIGGSLTMTGGAITPRVGNSRSAGIQFPTDPGGGGGDEAFIRYYVVSGETTKLLIGTNNDADDTVGIWQAGAERLTVYSGNVGIGTPTPVAPLHVNSPSEFVARFEANGSRSLMQWMRNGQLLWDTGVGTDANNANFWWGDFTAYRMVLERGTGNLSVTGRLTAPGGKNFQIDHPLDPKGKDLVHACLEGPELGLYYRGEARLEDGVARVELPSYFEAMVRKEDRTVQLTPKLEGKGPVSSLAASGVEEGRFVVRATDRNNPSQAFFWEVKGVRADLERLQPEVPKRKG